MNKLKIFVGSSSEAKSIDIKVRHIIEENDIEPIPWRTIFHPGEFGLESLIRITQEVDGAILIATCDDKLWYRGDESTAPRDNIIFEMGLFIKSFGRKNVGLIFVSDEKGNNPKIPSDLSGLNLIVFHQEKDNSNEAKLLRWIQSFKESTHPVGYQLEDVSSILRDNFNSIPESWKDEIKNYIVSPFKSMSIGALQGEFALNSGQYYDSLYSSLLNSNDTTIIRAVSLLSAELWNRDPHQKRFYDFNVEAKKKGSTIKRLFVAAKEQVSNYWPIMQEQIEDGIEIKTINPKIFAEYAKLDDAIIFESDGEFRSYVSTPFYDNPFRLKGAHLILNQTLCKEQARSFDSVWSMARNPSPTTVSKQKREIPPPGIKMKASFLDVEVITCEEAATAKNIPLKNELKTLILQTKSGLIAVHIRGDQKLSLNAVKNTIGLNDVRMADPEKIASIDLLPGTVSAVLSPVWELPHLISKKILSLDYVSTNNGTKNGYFTFDPVIIMDAKSTIIGNFEK